MFSRPRSRPIRGLVIAVGAIAGVLAVDGLQNLVTQVDHYPEQLLFARDLTAVTLDTGAPAMDDFLFPSQDVELLRNRLGSRDPDAVIGLEPPAVTYSPWADAVGAGVINNEYRRQWPDMIKRDPMSYLRSRLDLFLVQAGISRDVRSPYFAQSDELPAGGVAGVGNSFPQLLNARNRVLSWTDGTSGSGSIWHVPALYLIAATGSIWMIGRWSGERRAAAVLIAVLAAMQTVLFFTAPTAEYRFQFFQVVLGTTFFAVLLALTITQRPGADANWKHTSLRGPVGRPLKASTLA